MSIQDKTNNIVKRWEGTVGFGIEMNVRVNNVVGWLTSDDINEDWIEYIQYRAEGYMNNLDKSILFHSDAPGFANILKASKWLLEDLIKEVIQPELDVILAKREVLNVLGMDSDTSSINDEKDSDGR